jgi:hypothetical protein
MLNLETSTLPLKLPVVSAVAAFGVSRSEAFGVELLLPAELRWNFKKRSPGLPLMLTKRQKECQY